MMDGLAGLPLTQVRPSRDMIVMQTRHGLDLNGCRDVIQAAALHCSAKGAE